MKLISLPAIFVLPIVVMVMTSCGDPPLNAPNNQTLNNIRLIYAFVSEAEYESGKPITQILTNEPPNGKDYNASLVRILDKRLGAKMPKRSPDGVMRLLDAWGHPFEIYPNKTAVELGFPKDFLREKQALAIWSIGFNGKNEFGRGDDVVYKPSE